MKYWSYLQEYKKYRSKILKTIDLTLKSGNLFFGKELKKFERQFIKYIVSCCLPTFQKILMRALHYSRFERTPHSLYLGEHRAAGRSSTTTSICL